MDNPEQSTLPIEADDSDASVAARLEQWATPQPAEAPAAEEQAAAEPAPEAEEAGEEQAAEAQQDDDTFEFTDDDGTVLKLPKRVQERVKRWDDYVRDKAETSNMRKAAEDRLRFAEAREALMGQVFEDASELRTLQQQLKQFENVDWAAFDSAPGQAMRLQQQIREIERKIGEKQATIQQKAGHVQRAVTEHQAKQWAIAEQAAVQRLGKITAEENAAMEAQLGALGIDVADFKARFAHPGIIQAIYKAAKFDLQQAGNRAAKGQPSKAPPTIKPGATKTQGAVAMDKYKSEREVLRRTGSEDAAARLLARFK